MEMTEIADLSPASLEGCIGYVVLIPLSVENQQKAARWQEKFSLAFPDTLSPYLPETLHITVLSWFTPYVSYSGRNDELFKKSFQEYDQAFSESVAGIAPYEVAFDTLHANSSAVYLTGEDRGQMNLIREKFLKQVEILPGTKMPPTIIHVSLTRFLKEVPLQSLRDFLAREPLVFSQPIHEFHLLRDTKAPKETSELVKKYVFSQ